jgi:hypothetical protein
MENGAAENCCLTSFRDANNWSFLYNPQSILVPPSGDDRSLRRAHESDSGLQHAPPTFFGKEPAVAGFAHKAVCNLSLTAVDAAFQKRTVRIVREADDATAEANAYR